VPIVIHPKKRKREDVIKITIAVVPFLAKGLEERAIFFDAGFFFFTIKPLFFVIA
jgi:hypothetical protein